MIQTTLSVGPYEVFVLVDGTYEAPIADLLHMEDADRRHRAVADWPGGRWSVDVNCFALSGPDGLILVDAGAGDHWGPAYGKATARLIEAGFQPEQVTAVLLTHIHGDHALGLLDGDKPRFPNADIYVPQGDLAWYGDADNLERTPPGIRGSFRTVGLLDAAYGVQVKPVNIGPVLPGISAIALPGHTPGHTGYLIHDDRRSLLLFGDVVHLDTLQFADPQFGFTYDLDPGQALHSRQTALDMAAREGWFVGGGHISGIRHIVRVGDGFAYAQENSG